MRRRRSKPTIGGAVVLVVLLAVFRFLVPEAEDVSDKSVAAEEAHTDIIEEMSIEDGDENRDEAAVLSSSGALDASGNMEIHFLDVGQGLSILVQSEEETLIYDGGNRNTTQSVVAYLKQLGIERIDYLISSHYDADHVNGLIACLNVFDIGTVISSDYEHDSKTYRSFIDKVAELGLTMEHPPVGAEYEFGSGKFIILAPEEIDENDSNHNSVAIKLINGNNSFIFTGDAEYSSEEAMCRSDIDLDCDVLVLGHHGSATATSWDFLKETVPEYAIISCGEGNQHGHPHEDVMEKLESMEISIFRTDKQGTVRVVSDGNTLDWDQSPCEDYSSGEKE